MTHKTAKRIYWTGTALTSLWFASKVNVLGPSAAVDAVIAFIMVTVTYIMFRKVYPANYAKLA